MEKLQKKVFGNGFFGGVSGTQEKILCSKIQSKYLIRDGFILYCINISCIFGYL